MLWRKHKACVQQSKGCKNIATALHKNKGNTKRHLSKHRQDIPESWLSDDGPGQLLLTRRRNNIVGYVYSRNKIVLFVLNIHLPLVQSMAFKLQLAIGRHRLSLNNGAYMIAAYIYAYTNFTGTQRR